MENGPRSTRTVVEVRIGGERVGQLTPKMSGELLPAVRHLAERGAATVARALVKGNRLKADVVLHCQRAGELAAEWFDQPVRRAGGSGLPDRSRPEPTRTEPTRSEPTRVEPVPVLPPAGWYADPTTPGQWRWWDGSSWTGHVAPR